MVMNVSSDRDTVAIGIPIYRGNINALEQISVNQVFRILGKRYIIYYIMPKSLRVNHQLPSAHIVRFNDGFFKNTETYSGLLLSLDFYQAFKKYKYLLIYQLDAFVFSDRLQYFCSLNYDYIGAPAPRNLWPDIKKRVGNGGLSLRKISSMIRVLKIKQDILEKARDELPDYLIRELLMEEDKFFAYCSTLDEIGIKTPSINIACKFSIEFDVAHAYRKMKKELPFGCHRWYSDNFDVWWPFIEQYGYSLNDDDKWKYTCSGKYKEARKLHAYKYLFHRIIRWGCVRKIRNNLAGYFDLNTEYSIWGYGKEGKECLCLFQLADIKVTAIYDSNIKKIWSDIDIPIIYPNKNELANKTSKIIIATTKFQEEIKKYLDTLNLKEGEDYHLFSAIKYFVCSSYYR